MNKPERIRQGDFLLIGFNISRLREQMCLQNRDMMTKLQLEGIPISTITLSKIEQESCNPTTAQMVALQKILECNYNDFFQLP